MLDLIKTGRRAGGPGGETGAGGAARHFAEAEAAFRDTYPDYASTDALDELRARDYARLDAQDQVYLDYTGGSLHAESQVRAHMALLSDQVLGNPHSVNPTSGASTTLVEAVRVAVLQYFQAPLEEYAAIFTANASGALKLVGESYPFAPGDRYLLTVDNHNSVNGIREFARARGAVTTYVPVTPPELRIDEARLAAELESARPGGHNLLAYPAQSNFSGVQHGLDWIPRAQARGWDVLLDASAFAPTNRLDLRCWRPDFVTLSFYKIFGYPTSGQSTEISRDKGPKAWPGEGRAREPHRRSSFPISRGESRKALREAAFVRIRPIKPALAKDAEAEHIRAGARRKIAQ